MPRRALDLRSFEEVLAEVARLQRDGYDRAGQWDLAQICDHCAVWIEYTLDGFPFRIPWFVRMFLGRWMLRRVLRQRQFAAGVPTPQKNLLGPGADLVAAEHRLQRAIDRLQLPAVVTHPSPLFGTLTPDEWRELHLIHCQHHLSFLVPRS
jgi:hypothetical protein